MYPTFKTSVIAFPHIEQRSARPAVTTAEVEAAVKLAAEDIKISWLKSHATSHKICARTRLINAAMVSGISDNAFRILCLQLSYTNGTDLQTAVGNDTIAALAGCNEKTVKRSNRQLEAKGWVTVKRRRRDSAIRCMAIPEDVMAKIGSEIMENLTPTSAAILPFQEGTKVSLQGVLPGQKGIQEGTEMSLQGVSPGYNSDQEGTKMSPLKVLPGQKEIQEGTEMSPLEILPGQNGGQEGTFDPDFDPDFDLRRDIFVPLICIKEKTRKKRGAESECIQSTRGLESALPPKVERTPDYVEKVAAAVLAGLAGSVPAAAAPAEPPAIVQPAPEIPECWSTPKARQAAFLRPAEARAQREVLITPDGRLEATGAFRSELEATFPLVDVVQGLLASAVNVRPYMTAIEVMQTVRRQFVYLQGDAKRRADRDKAISALHAAKSPQAERVPASYDENGRPLYRSR